MYPGNCQSSNSIDCIVIWRDIVTATQFRIRNLSVWAHDIDNRPNKRTILRRLKYKFVSVGIIWEEEAAGKRLLAAYGAIDFDLISEMAQKKDFVNIGTLLSDRIQQSYDCDRHNEPASASDYKTFHDATPSKTPNLPRKSPPV